MVILRLRASLCSILGSILSCIFGFDSDLPPPVPLVSVLAGPTNHCNTGFLVDQTDFSSTITVGFRLPFPCSKATELSIPHWVNHCFAFAFPTSTLRVPLFPGERHLYDVTTVGGISVC